MSKGVIMLFGAVLLGVVVPLTTNPAQPVKLIGKPYIVQAVIDSAQLIGLPCSKAAKAYAQKKQTPDPVLQQISFTPEPVSARKLFFREYFHGI